MSVCQALISVYRYNSYPHPSYIYIQIEDVCKRTSYMFDPDLYIDRDKATGRCVLGMPAVPLVTPKGRENDECAKEHPHLSVKVVAPMDNQDVPAKYLDIYFSDNFGENFYNQDIHARQNVM